MKEQEFSALKHVLVERIGFNLTTSQIPVLKRRASMAAKEFGFNSVPAFIDWLQSSPLSSAGLEILISHFTTGETYFWREPSTFETFERVLVPSLIARKGPANKSIRIWSAGCSSGEEPYSIAIALKRCLPYTEDWNITILATDLNPRLLEKAKRGIYGKWSFRNVPDWFITNYFDPIRNQEYKIRDGIREMVTFNYHNLVTDPFPSALNQTQAMDLIFCRNVLMYLDLSIIRRISLGFYNCLVEEGYLIVGLSELSQELFSGFSTRPFPGVVFYQKTSKLPENHDRFELNEQQKETEILSLTSLLPVINHEKPTTDSQSKPASTDQTNYATTWPESDELSPENSKALSNNIRQLANDGNLIQALEVCEQSLKVRRLDPLLNFFRAVIQQELHLENEAITSFYQTLYVSPDFLLAHFSLAVLLQRTGDIKRAKKHFQNALELLQQFKDDETVPESDGIMASRLREIIHANNPEQ